MIKLEDLTFQKLNEEGLKTLVDWARQEGWNPGVYDYKVFWNTDPDGFYGFYLDDKLIAGGAVVSYNGAYGFMGLFIVHPDYRGQGIGNKLWYLRRDFLLSRLNPNATIGMDGVVDMQPFYAKGGFKIAFKDERYERIGTSFEVSPHISDIQPLEIDKVEAYDKVCFGFTRTTFLKPWITLPNGKAFKYTKNNKLVGYAVIRAVDSGYKIGPLFANNNQVAEELYKACLNYGVGEKVYLDIPMVNKEAVDLVKIYNAEYVFECARMYYGEPPKVDVNKVFGITTFELG